MLFVKAIFFDVTTICNMCNFDVVTHVIIMCNMAIHMLPYSVAHVINMCYICAAPLVSI
ncbi:hypothetical protein HanRHA438_Chr06g0272071 [Helianthus annuus]|nr:hypothetical protein HanRHA438_Chr06g0272071 [Helianthus annuus]